ncbi:MAG: hypothetical protein ACFCUQ_12865, partial [Kiloniellales bacterium]
IKGVQRLLRDNGGKATAEVKDAGPAAAHGGGSRSAASGARGGGAREPLQRLLRELTELRELLCRAGF